MDGGIDGGINDGINGGIDDEINGGMDGGINVETHGRASGINDEINVETHGRASLRDKYVNPELLTMNQITPTRLPKSISSFMAGFKSAVNTQIDNYIDKHQLKMPKYNRDNHFFQPNYHDHIIRNHLEYQTISNYIINNPHNWNKDKLHDNK